MSATLLIGLFLQATAATLLVAVLRRHSLRLLGPIFVFMAVLFHGVTELVQAFFSTWSYYDAYAAHERVDEWVWTVGLTLLVFAVSYLVTLSGADLSRDRPTDLRLLDWRPLAVLAVPAYAAAVYGRAATGESYLLGGLSAQLLLVLVPLLMFDLVRRYGQGWLIPVLLVEAAMFALIGSRGGVLVVVAATVFATARVGIRLQLTRLGVVALVGVVAVVSMSSARLSAGLFGGATAHGPGERIQALQGGLSTITEPDTRRLLVSNAVYRIDGNAFPSLISEALHGGSEPLWTGPIRTDLNLMVPRFLDPDKETESIIHRNEEVRAVRHFGLPENVDFLPTALGMLYTMGGTAILYVFAAVGGVAFARFDEWVNRRNTAVTMAAAVGLAVCVLQYERGLTVYFVTARGVLVLLVGLWGWHQLNQYVMRRVAGRGPGRAGHEAGRTTVPG